MLFKMRRYYAVVLPVLLCLLAFGLRRDSESGASASLMLTNRPRAKGSESYRRWAFLQEIAGRAAQAEKDGSMVLPAEKGWLFYLPDVYYLTNPSFLQKTKFRSLKTIVDLKRQLAAHGITLIVMPIPSKATIHPEMLPTAYGDEVQTPQNPSFEPFRWALEKEGVLFFDPTKILLEAKAQTGAAQYMPADTHWTFDAMERVAEELAGMIKERVALPARPPVAYTRRPTEVSNISDIVFMVESEEQRKQFGRQHSVIQQVLQPSGALWQSSRDADILVLGDSFTNIYSYGGKWGTAAGLAEQLSFHLQRPIDRIAIDGSAAHETRVQLRRELLRGHSRLAGKRVVIFQFSARYLLSSNWKILELYPDPALMARKTTSPSKLARSD